MKKICKLFSLLLAVIGATVFAACGACGGKGPSTVRLTVWCPDRDMEMTKNMCKAFAEQHREVQYEFLYAAQGEGDAAESILKDLEAGADVFSFAGDQINKLIPAGALARLGGQNLATMQTQNLPDSVAAATVKIDGEERAYAYPVTADNGYFLYYDKRVLSEEDVSSLDGILKKGTASKQFAMPLNDGWYLSAFFFALPELGYEVTYDDNLNQTSVKINFDDENGEKVAQALYRYICNPAVMSAADDSKIISGFEKGTVIAAVSGSWNATDLQRVLGENLGTAKLPTVTIEGAQVQLSSYAGYKLIGVNGYSKNKGEAHKLALWLTNYDNQMTRYRARGFAPTNLRAAENEEVKADPILSALAAQRQFARTQKDVPTNYWTPTKGFGNALIGAKDGSMTKEKLKQQLVAMCENIRKTA